MILVLPPTCKVPVPVWLNALLTVIGPATVLAPPVWLKVPSANPALPTDKLPPDCVKASRVTPPLTANDPPLCTSAPALPRLSICTRLPASAGDTAVVEKLTVLPAGITTFATLARSGTTPVLLGSPVTSQLAGSNQLPVVPPFQVTELRRVISAVVLPVVAAW